MLVKYLKCDINKLLLFSVVILSEFIYTEQCDLPDSDEIGYTCYWATGETYQECSGKVSEGIIVQPWCKGEFYSLGLLTVMRCIGGTFDNSLPTCIPEPPTDLLPPTLENYREPVSRPISCILPKAVIGGRYDIYTNKNDTAPNQVPPLSLLEYHCNTGYDLSQSSAICLYNSQWSDQPTCRDESQLSRFKEKDITPPERELSGMTCILPRYPQNGRYAVLGATREYSIGDLISEYALLQYNCDEGYDASVNLSICLASVWTESPVCLKRCQMPTSYSVDFTCLNSAGRQFPCTELVPIGTILQCSCKTYHVAKDFISDLTCVNGLFDPPPPKCRPDCGVEVSVGVPQVIGGMTAKRGTLPWHVALYRDFSGDEPEYLCGGSLIATNAVVSAAHCFYDSKKDVVISEQYYLVAAGKYYRDWNHEEENTYSFVQKSKVRKLHIPQKYGGDQQNQQSDLAVVQLESPFKLSNFVHAVCLDLTNADFNQRQITPGSLGKVAGWGLTAEDGSTSPELLIVTLPIIEYNDCRIELEKYEFRKFLTNDKICAGYTNGTSVCQGDSGGGLIFSYYDSKEGQTKWVLRGIVSVSPYNERSTSCRSNSYASFTSIFEHKEWMMQVMRNMGLTL